LAGQFKKLVTRGTCQRTQLIFTADLLKHQPGEFFERFHIAVERGCSGTVVRSDSPDGYRTHALVIGLCDRSRDDFDPGVLGFGAGARLAITHQGDHSYVALSSTFVTATVNREHCSQLTVPEEPCAC